MPSGERLIDAEWEDTSDTEGGGQYLAELKMYSRRQTGASDGRDESFHGRED